MFESFYVRKKKVNFVAVSSQQAEGKMDGTKFSPIFLVCVIVGAIIVFIPGNGLVAGGQLLYYGMQGLLVEQQVAKGAIEFNREVYLRELDEKHRVAEHERQMQIQRLQRPAAPDEGY